MASRRRARSPLVVAGVGVALALAVAGVWCGRLRPPVAEPAIEATVAIRITRHDAFGAPGKPRFVREVPRVRAIVGALGIDRHPVRACPADYASAEVGLLLSGRDVYARRNVYVWGLFADGGAPDVLVVSSSGCRGGVPTDAATLRSELGE